MKYKTKSWELDAFCYDPYDIKPDWFLEMLVIGKAFEYLGDDPVYVSFKDKRSTHKVLIGDTITRDEFGRIDVYSAKHLLARVEKKQDV